MAVMRFNKASTSPQLDAEILLHAMTGIHRAAMHAWPERLLTTEQLEDLQPAITRRERGEPIAYIVGRQEFWSMPLEVSPAVLIPRPETELLVELTLVRVPLNDGSTVLDLGTGSGAIALAIAQARAHARVTALEISRDAIDIAERNRRALGIDNLSIRHSDWYAELTADRFDVIVSNPPYVAESDPDLARGVAEFEPKLAVIAGPTGFEAIERVIAQSRSHLLPKGWLLVEHGAKQGAAVRSLLVQAGFDHVRSYSDLAGLERVSEGRSPDGE
jgi:release factor glutamine methyltransferase